MTDTRRHAGAGTARSHARPSGCRTIAEMGFDVVYLPPIHPIGRVNRKGRNNTLVARPEDVGSPWAIGSAEGGHDAIHPQLGTLEDFRDFVGADPRAGPGGRAGPGAAVRAGPPVGHRAPGVVHHPPGRHDRVRGEPAEEVPGHLPAQLRQRPEGDLRRGAAGRAALGRRTGVKIFRVDNPHTKPLELLALADRQVKTTDPDVLFLAEAFTRPAMMHGLGQDRLHPVVHVLHLAHGGVGDARVLPRSWSPRPTTCGPTSWPTRRTSCTSPAARRAADVQDPRGAGRACCRRPGACTPATSCSSTSPRAGQRGVPGQREVPAAAARLGRAERQGRSLAPFLARLNADPARAPGPALAAQPALPPGRQRRACSCFSKRDRRDRATPCWWSCSLDSARRAVGRRHARHARARASTGTSGSPCTTSSPARDYEWGQHNSVRLDPHRRAGARLRVQALR